MTYHFINLVSWRYFDNYTQDQKRYLDSFSITLLAFLYGIKLTKVSGISFYHNNKIYLKEALYLVSETNHIFKHQLALPYWEDIDDIIITNAIRSEVKDFQKIVLGISSPKQDVLASLIQNEFPQKEIYCLGAAIYTDLSFNRFDSRFLWVYFLLKSPRRTVFKIKHTLIEFFSILFKVRKRNEFKLFLKTIK